MSEVKIKINDESLPKIDTAFINSFLDVVANTLLSGINDGTITCSKTNIICEKCGRVIDEYTLSITPTIRFLFVIKPTIVIKMAYDVACGLNYFRIKF